MSENLTAEELADLKAKAEKAAADIVGFEINPVHDSEKPPGLLTKLFNVWAECRNRDGSTDVSRFASGMLREDAEFIMCASPARVLSLLTALEEAEGVLKVVRETIPMDYLERHPGDIPAAMRAYAKDRWALIELFTQAKARAEKAERQLERILPHTRWPSPGTIYDLRTRLDHINSIAAPNKSEADNG